jgi:hypothetical protein
MYFEFCDLDGTHTGGQAKSLCTTEEGLYHLFGVILDFCGPCFTDPISGAVGDPAVMEHNPDVKASAAPVTPAPVTKRPVAVTATPTVASVAPSSAPSVLVFQLPRLG